uniref:Fatty acid synthase n=1 Tax=Timema monikensis TaxID=170555 RepID=A0A7R9EHU2_9NEOP|nr:unnamed protein product [Timema monikensis]
MPWSGGLAAVNAVGLSGDVGHILLRSHSKEKVNGGLPTDDLPRLLVISGRTEEGLQETFSKLESQPVDVDCVRILHDLYSSHIPNYNYRGYTLLGTNRQYREIRIALVDFLKAINIIPDGYIGHSVGELGCAYIDGCLTAEETILAAYYRGLASKEAELIPGYMAAIGMYST